VPAIWQVTRGFAKFFVQKVNSFCLPAGRVWCYEQPWQ